MNRIIVFIKRSGIIALLLVSFSLSAQNLEFDKVKKSGEYIWGAGKSDDPEIANEHALKQLAEQISVSVQSEFERYAMQANKHFTDSTVSVTKTYSNVVLTNASSLEFEKRGITYVLRYITKTDVIKMFENREKKVCDYLLMGTKAERKNKMGDALRYYYWAYALCLSHPYRDNIFDTVDGYKVRVDILLENRISTILQNLTFHVDDKIKYKDSDKTKLEISCVCNGEKVGNLDYKYIAGGHVSTLCQIENGRGEIVLYGAEQDALEKIRLKIEYKYRIQSKHDEELNSVLNVVQPSFSKESAKILSIPGNVSKVTAKKIIAPDFKTINTIEGSHNYYSKTVKQVLIDIVKQDYIDAYQYFTPTGKEMFIKLIQNGKVSVLPLRDDTLKIIQLADEVVVRSVPMSFYFPNSHQQYIENVVFTFNNLKQIDAISFAISDRTIYDIVSKSDKFGTAKDKYTLLKFLEYYKTAYNLKRLDYIESIFSDDALIIVGTVLKHKKRIDDMYHSIGEKAVRYQRYTKEQYIENLRRSFNSKEYINIKFDDAIIKKVNGNKKIYGIQIAQNYYSSNYNDFGYLFLMIDLEDSLHPTIYVRTWQPQRNDDGSIYGLNDFRLN